MDRAQILLVGLPLFLFCTDLLHLFSPPPPPPQKPSQPHHHHERPVASQVFDNPSLVSFTILKFFIDFETNTSIFHLSFITYLLFPVVILLNFRKLRLWAELGSATL